MRTPYSLPEADCERLKRTEMIGMRMLLAHLSSAAYFQEDLHDRLECIPDGNRRLRLAIGGLRAVCDDLIGTITRAQAKQIYGTMKDYDLRLVPKLTPGTVNIILTKEQGKDLMDLARAFNTPDYKLMARLDWNSFGNRRDRSRNCPSGIA